jgi:hypothetical protein
VYDPDPIAEFDRVPRARAKKSTRSDLVLTDFASALAAKLALCTADADITAKRIKTIALTEIPEFIRSDFRLGSPQPAQVIAANELSIFRRIPEIQPWMLRSDDMISITEPTWPHYCLSGVPAFQRSFISSVPL